ncbi:MarR family winged helix-turn-helix transcriptional regulator [Paenactinomyces guangxiensis]|uniref:MarR family transcriptional regulator n=1 Tax=Paenactinomyces guangxiensis TaxID=1490290 RepID=A0A7W1WS96_9BACL|nr:MarR family transcriptional regulator [Paenactinomyces guangxiensis]MBA4495067.1 MarR family transcriptional regulator [Paenactinomyces guangxiensis]MBH8592249.1 MarR family transcriptional regulator [Paenactinomyces guangxiensis]
MAQARKEVFAWYEKALEPLGLTPSYVYVLGVLKDLKEATPSEISKLVELERPTVTRILDRMEKNEWIERFTNPANRRETIVKLTERGIVACDEAYPKLMEADHALNEMIEGDLETLKEQIKALNLTLKESQ